MDNFYGEQNRSFQDKFGTRKMADLLKEVIFNNEFDEDNKTFIESLSSFFLTTIDHQGRPTVSHKGGDAGYIKIIDKNTLIFPSYNGNGMYLSMGNLNANAQIGLLFISFETPRRVRMQGVATISKDPALLALYKEADMIVSVKLTDLWINCPRYVPKYERVRESRYTPRTDIETPLAGWKQIDGVEAALGDGDLAKKKNGELCSITVDEWMGKVRAGDPTA
ncbi:MAG: pyridoxamine 5'-phosphate oxidase family protein [Methylotenera sp.]|nr:pyridoxamine 5'-phosphate oxidase family protein [Methylotenera sp.]